MMDRNKEEEKKVMSDVRGGGGLHNFDLNAENDDKKPIRLQMSS